MVKTRTTARRYSSSWMNGTNFLNVPNGDSNNPQNPNILGAAKIFRTLPTILSARYEDGLLPVELAHSVASLSTYPSAKVLSMFAEATKHS